MYDESFLERDEHQRLKARKRWLVLLVGGAIVVVASIFLVLWQTSAFQISKGGKISSQNQIGNQSQIQDQKKGGPSRFPSEAQAILLQQIAQGLHLSPDQLTARLQAGESIQAIATQQGVSPGNLHELVIQAYQKALARWQSVSSVKFSPNDILNQVTNAPPDALSYIVKTDCLGEPNPNL